MVNSVRCFGVVGSYLRGFPGGLAKAGVEDLGRHREDAAKTHIHVVARPPLQVVRDTGAPCWTAHDELKYGPAAAGPAQAHEDISGKLPQ